jgi:ABC-type lipoprotein export system ATPase subunit
MLEIVDLTFRYHRHGPLIISQLTETFAEGSMAALRAPSGGGKSTLLYVCGLMLKPTSGHIVLGGEHAAQLTDGSRSLLRAERIGFVFQDAALDLTRSVEENVLEGVLYSRVGRRHARQAALDLLEEFGVADRGSARASQLSGGQAQRVALCRALLKSPWLILADEPTGNLDVENSELVVKHLRNAADLGACVLIATHDDRVASLCDRTVVIETGSYT